MRIIVTCGPSYEPIDEVRRITNFSTGELGMRLTRQLRTAGHEVICFRGEAATWPDPEVENSAFSTNDDLFAKLEATLQGGAVDAIFHAAALADFKVARRTVARKIPSQNELTLTLIPAVKILGKLRRMAARARIVGWKYELDGTPQEAVAKGRAQIAACTTDACVVNGAAYGNGFGFLDQNGMLTHLADKAALCIWLLDWLSSINPC